MCVKEASCRCNYRCVQVSYSASSAGTSTADATIKCDMGKVVKSYFLIENLQMELSKCGQAKYSGNDLLLLSL